MNNLNELIGKRYNSLTIIEKTDIRNRNGTYKYKCKCDCGKETIIDINKVISGHTKSCGCLKSISRLNDISEKRFGNLTVVKKLKNKRGQTCWSCKCDCGKSTVVETYKLIHGYTKSCGCLRVRNGEEKLKDLSGQRFGKLLVVKRGGTGISCGGQKRILWECVCDCGNVVFVPTGKLKQKLRISCPSCSLDRIKGAIRQKGEKHYMWSGFGEITGSFWCRIFLGAKKRNLIFEIDIEYCWDLFLKQNKKCALTGLDLCFAKTSKEFAKGKSTASLDRIDSSLGYIKGNVQWVHKDVNFMKQSSSQEDFIKMCKLVSKNNKKNI